jgi:hypothetical protein
MSHKQKVNNAIGQLLCGKEGPSFVLDDPDSEPPFRSTQTLLEYGRTSIIGSLLIMSGQAI